MEIFRYFFNKINYFNVLILSLGEDLDFIKFLSHFNFLCFKSKQNKIFKCLSKIFDNPVFSDSPYTGCPNKHGN